MGQALQSLRKLDPTDVSLRSFSPLPAEFFEMSGRLV